MDSVRRESQDERNTKDLVRYHTGNVLFISLSSSTFLLHLLAVATLSPPFCHPDTVITKYGYGRYNDLTIPNSRVTVFPSPGHPALAS